MYASPVLGPRRSASRPVPTSARLRRNDRRRRRLNGNASRFRRDLGANDVAPRRKWIAARRDHHAAHAGLERRRHDLRLRTGTLFRIDRRRAPIRPEAHSGSLSVTGSSSTTARIEPRPPAAWIRTGRLPRAGVIISSARATIGDNAAGLPALRPRDACRAGLGLGRRQITRPRAHLDAVALHAHRDAAEAAVELGVRRVIVHQVVRAEVRHHARRGAAHVVGVEHDRAIGLLRPARARRPAARSSARDPARAWPAASARSDRRTPRARADR